MSDNDLQKLKDECRRIEDDSLYTAEIHYIIGSKLACRAVAFKFIPAGIAVIAALMLLWGAPKEVAWITFIGSVVTITNLLLDPDKKSREHFAAAKEFTVVKHEARSLYETFSAFMSAQEFYLEVRRSRDKYNSLAKNTPPTDNEKAWQQARKNIQEGRHTADFLKGSPPRISHTT